MSLNLARRPFVNTRPITRLSIVLWLAGGALAIWNGLEIWRQVSSFDERRHALAEAENGAAAAAARIAGLEASLKAIDLKSENEEAAFLNREIDRRTLSWTLLFERLGEVLPRQVRLLRIAPALGSSAQRRGPQRGGADRDWIPLSLVGYAENDEALLDFVDALFSHPAFDAPDLQREAVAPGQPVQFDLKVEYLPSSDAAVDAAGVEPAAATPETPGGVVGREVVPPGGLPVPMAPRERAAATGTSTPPASTSANGTATAIGAVRGAGPARVVAGRPLVDAVDGGAAVEPTRPEVAPGMDEAASPEGTAAAARWVPRAGRAVGGATIGTPVEAGAPPLTLGGAASATRRLR